MELPVVVGADGSEASLRAVDWAADAAALRGLPLRVVYASLWERYEGAALAADLGGDSDAVPAADVLSGAVRRAEQRQPEVKVTGDVVPEEAEYVLVREGRNATVVVVGTSGRGAMAEALLGSVSVTVAGHADCPVVVVRGDRTRRAAPGRVVVGVGDGPGEAAVVRFAAEEAYRRGVPLEAVRAWRHPAHDGERHPLFTGGPARPHEEHAVELLEAALADLPADLPVRRRTAEGHARAVLTQASHDAALLVVGSRRRLGSHGLQLGRVTHGVLLHAPCPVAVVPHP
ncbi:universal stress protein [Streptomyces griseosporeus]|uniref:universal stress protein n=1 Tax=Streptomyces griseosporeus TaxID=1910 RepID=UPI0036F68B03